MRALSLSNSPAMLESLQVLDISLGVVFGAIALATLLLVILLIVCLCYRRKKNDHDNRYVTTVTTQTL